MSPPSRPFYLILILLLYLGLSLFLLYPGTLGPFLLDDSLNLSYLTPFNILPHYSLTDFILQLYENGKHTRLVSFLTFAAQHESWPNSPQHFKTVNLAIHYVNAILAFWLTFQIADRLWKHTFSRTALIYFSLLISFIWLIHPIQQSTTFYAIQRMTQLSSFFMLLGVNLFLYLYSRFHLNQFKFFLTLTTFIGCCLTLAVFSKGNGLLLTLYLLLVHSLFKQQVNYQKPFYMPHFEWTIIYLPLLLFGFYLLLTAQNLSDMAVLRDIPPWQRFITETRILFRYLGYILVPDVFSGGLFHDNIVISQSLFSPLSSLVALCGIIFLLVFAWRLRKQHFPLFLGVFWFFISHSMESTFIPLELYFEHRNYLALLGIIWVVTYLLFLAFQRFPKSTLFFSICYLALIVFFSWYGSKIWSQKELILVNWGINKESSPRAQLFVADYWIEKKQLDKAIEVYDKAASNHPKNLLIRLNQLLSHCQVGKDTAQLIQQLDEEILHTYSHVAIGTTLNLILKEFSQGKCQALKYANFRSLLLKLSKHPSHQSPSIATDIYYALGKVEKSAGEVDKAMQAMDRSFHLYPDPRVAIIQAQWLLSINEPYKARDYLDKAKKILTKQQKKLEIEKIDRLYKTSEKLKKRIDNEQ